jgi:isopenicillin N synthase-like dioxygenase
VNVLRVDFQSVDAPKQFVRSLRETGFAVITNHSLSENFIQSLYQQWEAFFHSPEKFDYVFDPKKDNQDGYFPDGEIAKGHTIADLKEFFHIYPGSRMPSYLEVLTYQLRTALFDMAKTLLSWVQAELPIDIAKQLDRPLLEMISDERTLLRVLYYPALDGKEEKGAIRAAAHGDINLLTLIPAASADGLQVQDIQGQWHDVPCDFGNISVNVGDMLEMATQHYLKSTIHRVINPVESARRVPRMSMPLFMHPKADVALKPGFTAFDYLEERLKELGLRQY